MQAALVQLSEEYSQIRWGHTGLICGAGASLLYAILRIWNYLRPMFALSSPGAWCWSIGIGAFSFFALRPLTHWTFYCNTTDLHTGAEALALTLVSGLALPLTLSALIVLIARRLLTPKSQGNAMHLGHSAQAPRILADFTQRATRRAYSLERGSLIRLVVVGFDPSFTIPTYIDFPGTEHPPDWELVSELRTILRGGLIRVNGCVRLKIEDFHPSLFPYEKPVEVRFRGLGAVHCVNVTRQPEGSVRIDPLYETLLPPPVVEALRRRAPDHRFQIGGVSYAPLQEGDANPPPQEITAGPQLRRRAGSLPNIGASHVSS